MVKLQITLAHGNDVKSIKRLPVTDVTLPNASHSLTEDPAQLSRPYSK